MTTRYLAALPRGNIGVALGEISGGLCALDVDDDSLVERFLAVNPQLSDTLQTHGARGRVFWVRFTDNYPKRTAKLKTHSGKDAGEFRSNGAQSIVWGIHPDTNRPYQFVIKKPVVRVAFSSIQWPPEIRSPFATGDCTEETEEPKIQKSRSTEELKSSASLARSLFHSSINSIEDALRVSMPTKKRENNALLFKLARAVKTLEVKGQNFDLPQLDAIFDQWYARAKKFLRAGQTREDYYLEFMNACQRAKFPLGGVKVAEAWAKATSQPLPAEAMNFSNPQIRLLVAFLKQLQAMQGAEPFFITYRDCAALLGHSTHSTAATWLGALVMMKYIRVAMPGNERQATRYFYVWKGSS